MRAPDFQPIPHEKGDCYVRDQVGGPVWHRSRYRVLFADTDRTGAVYHGTYFRFFELGRATLLRDAQFPFRQVEVDGYNYPIFQLGLDFFRPLEHDDPIWIHTRMREVQRVRFEFEYIITHAESHVVTCRGFTRHCVTNRKGRPVAVDPMTIAVFTGFPV